jgi:hypothetical protein
MRSPAKGPAPHDRRTANEPPADGGRCTTKEPPTKAGDRCTITGRWTNPGARIGAGAKEPPTKRGPPPKPKKNPGGAKNGDPKKNGDLTKRGPKKKGEPTKRGPPNQGPKKGDLPMGRPNEEPKNLASLRYGTELLERAAETTGTCWRGAPRNCAAATSGNVRQKTSNAILMHFIRHLPARR